MIRKKSGRHRWIFWPSVIAVTISASLLYILWLPSVHDLKLQNPTSTALIKNRASSSNQKNSTIKQWAPLSTISSQLPRAVIAAEDASFYGHNGIAWDELADAIKESVYRLRLPRGASTITQQLAKNLYLSESYNPLRKIKEFLITRRLEKILGKKRILELYLNIIEWGPGIYGISAASMHYFGNKPSQLSASQAAFLAAIIPNPLTTFNPKLHPSRVEARKRKILFRISR